MTMTGTYFAYLAISICIAVYVTHTLHKHGRLFLIEVFSGNVQTADAVNHLLAVGCYLVNMAFVTLTLRYGSKAGNIEQAIEVLSTKVGLVLFVLGGMHVFNMVVLSQVRRIAARRPIEIITFLDD